MSFLFYLKVKKIVLMIFSPILNVIDPKKEYIYSCRFSTEKILGGEIYEEDYS